MVARRPKKPSSAAPPALERVWAALVDAVRTWIPGARGSWCRAQRRRLRERNSVVWVRDAAAVPWAVWGGKHGYFDVQYMDGIAYLSPVGGMVLA